MITPNAADTPASAMNPTAAAAERLYPGRIFWIRCSLA